MDRSRKCPVLLAFAVLAAGVAAVIRDWQWAVIPVAGLVVGLTLAVEPTEQVGGSGRRGRVLMSAERAAATEVQRALEEVTAETDPPRRSV
jgi:hypothetical protein